MERLKQLIDSLSDQPYHSIQQLTGKFYFPQFDFKFLTIQGSSGANPASIISINYSIGDSNIPQQYFVSAQSRLALAEFLIRRINSAISQFAQQNRGRDGSGSFHTIFLGQQMLERDSVIFSRHNIEIRFIVSLPGKGFGGGQFDATQAWVMINQELQKIVQFSVYYFEYQNSDKKLLSSYIEIQQTRYEINLFLIEKGFCCFINNGACLPRKSGVNDRPASYESTTFFQSPNLLQVRIPLSNNRSIQGMAIKQGITCITGGGFHGKSTLLQAILSGVYAHIPGDGREYVVTRLDAFLVRSEEGRSISNVDVSPFIKQLPNGLSTDRFSSEIASGSTSQAASMVEAIEAGSRLLLFDEDSCASNFLFRDELIKKLINKDPIQPLYSSVRSLWHQQSISMIFVIGGLGHFLQKADLCLLMENYCCYDLTLLVRKKIGSINNDCSQINLVSHRVLSSNNFNPCYQNKRLKKNIGKRIKVLRNVPRQLEYGMDIINLEAIPQLVESSQLLSIGYGLLKIREEMAKQPDQPQTITYWVSWLYDNLERYGLDFLQPDYAGLLSMPRSHEVAAAINRIRSLNVENK